MPAELNFFELLAAFTAYTMGQRGLSQATAEDYRLSLHWALRYAKARRLSAQVACWPIHLFQDCLRWHLDNSHVGLGILSRRRKAFAEFARFVAALPGAPAFDPVAIMATPIFRLDEATAPNAIDNKLEPVAARRTAQSRFRFDLSALPPNLAEFHQTFRQYLDGLSRERQLSANTIRIYGYAMRSLIHFLKSESLDITPRSFDKSLFYEYLASQGKRQISPATEAQFFTALRGFFKHLLETRYLSSNPLEFVRTPKLKRGLPRPLSGGELARLLTVMDLGHPKERRDLLIIELMLGSGLRISESLSLRVKDLLLVGGNLGPEVTVTGKGQKQRKVPLSTISVTLAMNWISSLRLEPQDFLFASPKRRAAHYRPTSFEHRFKTYLARAGLDSAISPHCLRHSFATLLADQDVDIRAIQEMLGHASLATTQVYTKVSAPRIHRLHRQSHPRNRPEDMHGIL